MKKIAKPETSRRSRQLTDEEDSLWQQVARTVEPIDPSRRSRATDSRKPANPPGSGPADPPPGSANLPATPPRSGFAPSYTPPVSARRSPVKPGAGIDDKSARKLLRGQITIDDRIDLHGMTQSQAHARLAAFLRRSHEKGLRHVLVITGKGRLSEGILRQAVPHWLAEPQLAMHVSAFRSAHVTHGGEGALYVRLRRQQLPGKNAQ